MADEKTQTLSPTQKPADEVKPSSARTAAEKKTRKEPRNPIDRQEGAHPMQGKSMSYVIGAGRSQYTEGANETDKVNEAEHFQN